MILKSFFRNKITIIYLIIFIVLFIILFLMNSSISYLNELKSNLNNSYLYIESNEDIKSDLLNNKNLKNITNILNLKYISSDILSKEDIVNEDINGIITCSDITLNKDEVIVYSNKSYSSNGYLTLSNNNIEITLRVNSVRSSKINKIVISEELFKELAIDNNYIYLVSILDEEDIKKTIQKYETTLIEDITENNYIKINKIKDMLSQFEIINMLFMIMFIIITIIINNNLLVDLKENIKLESILGFNNKQIIFNVYKRISILHLLSIIIAYTLYLIIMITLKYLTSISLSIIFLKYLYILIFILISDLLLILIVSNKSNKLVKEVR